RSYRSGGWRSTLVTREHTVQLSPAVHSHRYREVYVRGLLIAGLALGVGACAPPVTSVADVAIGNANFTELVRAVLRLDLAYTLDDRDARFTVFAPTDAAFEGVDTEALSDEVLASVVTYHVLAGVSLQRASLPPIVSSLSS